MTTRTWTNTMTTTGRIEYPLHAVKCDSCGAICTRALVGPLRAVRSDGTTDVASFFEPAARYMPAPKSGKLTWCCDCHDMGPYCLGDEHETNRLGAPQQRPDDDMITVQPGRPAPRCLAELAGTMCDLAKRGVAHAHRN